MRKVINFVLKNKINLFIIGIILLAAFLRFYNFPYRYSLGEETIRDAVVGIEGARQLQLPLVGPFSSLGPFTFGPWYWIQLTLFSLLVPSFYAPWIYLSLVSILYVFIIYKIGELIEGKKLGLLLAFIAAISPAQILSATHLTNPNNTNIFAILIIWIFLKVLINVKSKWWVFILGFLIGLGTNIHFQMAGFLILPALLFFRDKKKLLFLISTISGLFLSFLPFLFFELSNHWFNTRNIIYYVLHGKNAIYVPNRWLFYIRDFWPAFWSDTLGVPVYFGIILIFLFLLTIFFLFSKRKLSIQILFLFVAFLFNFVLLRYYWGHRFFGYLNFLRPFIFIFTGLTIVNFFKVKYGKYLGSLFLFSMIFLIFPAVIDRFGKDPFSLEIYQQIEILEKKMPDKKFNLYSCSKIYKGRYDALVFSSLFVLTNDHKIDKKGSKIGIKSEDCNYPNNEKNKKTKKDLTGSEDKIIEGTSLIDFSKASTSSLSKEGWIPVSFSSIYNTSTRWWFKEQP